MIRAYDIPYHLANLRGDGKKTETERLDDLQLGFRNILGKNIFAPCSDPKDILDLGAGSGAWCVEVANEFPTAQVSGFDLSAISRDDIPENCRFIVGNFLNGLKFDDNSLDLVHSRYLPWRTHLSH
jgi:ubiquinone/menaquinone biosynthesis C-methylase UbiE